MASTDLTTCLFHLTTIAATLDEGLKDALELTFERAWVKVRRCKLQEPLGAHFGTSTNELDG